MLGLLLCLSLLPGCDFGEGERVGLRRFPYPYRAALSVAEGELTEHPGRTGAVADSLRGVPLFDGRVVVRPGATVRTIGQDAPCSLIDRGKQLVECVRVYFSTARWPSAVHFGNRLLDARGTHHEVKLYAPALRGVPGVGTSSLAPALSERVLLELEAKGGFMLLSPAGLGDDAATEAATDRIAATGRTDRIAVLEQEELLRFRVIDVSLEWTSSESPDSIVIRIGTIHDPVAGSFAPTVTDLIGVTFYTPMPGSTAVYLGADRLSGLVFNPRDHTHRRSVTIAPDIPTREDTSL